MSPNSPEAAWLRYLLESQSQGLIPRGASVSLGHGGRLLGWSLGLWVATEGREPPVPPLLPELRSGCSSSAAGRRQRRRELLPEARVPGRQGEVLSVGERRSAAAGCRREGACAESRASPRRR